MTEVEADAVYNILVEHAGADEHGRREFAAMHANGRCDEYRFVGWLGFGGKFWRHDWRVSAYPEDITPGRQAIVDVTNAALADLRSWLIGAVT